MKPVKIKLMFDRRNEAKSPKTKGNLDVYIYDANSRKKIYINTGISVLRSQFNQPKGEIGEIIKHPNAVALNGELTRIYRGIEAFALSDRCKEITDIKNWDTKVGDKTNIVEFIKEELAKRNPSINVINRHNILIKRLEQFGKMKKFSDLSYENIVAFDRFLRDGDGDIEGISSATSVKRHAAFKSYIVEAINLGLCDYNPYITFKPKKGKSKDPIYLTEPELLAIANCDLASKTQNDRLIKVRDIFVFQCYTGLAYVDLKSFDKSDITEIDGYKVIKSNRQKTEQGYVTVLLPEAIEILEKYNYDLPVLSNQKYNEYLKALIIYVTDKKGNMLIRDKRLTSHVARHTCGTYLLNKGVPIETVARTLGHADTTMTRHYAKLLSKTVVSDVAKYVINAKK